MMMMMMMMMMMSKTPQIYKIGEKIFLKLYLFYFN